MRKLMLWIAAAVLLMPAARAQDTDSYEYYGRGLTPQESRGRDTWYFWTGGGEHMWRQITKITGGTVDLLLYAESAPRATRFKTLARSAIRIAMPPNIRISMALTWTSANHW